MPRVQGVPALAHLPAPSVHASARVQERASCRGAVPRADGVPSGMADGMADGIPEDTPAPRRCPVPGAQVRAASGARGAPDEGHSGIRTGLTHAQDGAPSAPPVQTSTDSLERRCVCSEALAREGDAVGDPPNQADLDGAPRRHALHPLRALMELPKEPATSGASADGASQSEPLRSEARGRRHWRGASSFERHEQPAPRHHEPEAIAVPVAPTGGIE